MEKMSWTQCVKQLIALYLYRTLLMNYGRHRVLNNIRAALLNFMTKFLECYQTNLSPNINHKYLNIIINIQINIIYEHFAHSFFETSLN